MPEAAAVTDELLDLCEIALLRAFWRGRRKLMS